MVGASGGAGRHPREAPQDDPTAPDSTILLKLARSLEARLCSVDRTHQRVDWIVDGTPSLATAEHARHVIEIIEAGYRAADTGQTQDLATSF